MIKNIRICLLLTLLFSIFAAQAERPKIGLALSGGGSKGSAHIAIIEWLEANNIPVDFIAGTSIGAYVGGLYALGYSAEEIKIIMYQADFDSGFSDAIDRDKLPYRTKRQHDKFNVALELGFGDGEILLPWGVLYGHSMTAVYRRSVGNLSSFQSFDDMAIPFRAIATDLTTSQPVVLDRGDLVRVMKASATVPGALVPSKLDGKYLVDGGMSTNLPISEVRNMGADIVIAVDISAPLYNLDQLKNAISVLEQISGFLTVHNVKAERAKLGKGDIFLRPAIDHLGTSDFSKLDEAFDAGRVAAEQQLEALLRLAVSSEEYLQYKQQKSKILNQLIMDSKRPVVKIVLDNQSDFKTEFLLDTLGLQTDAPITIEELLAAVDRLYSLDRFELVDAVFEERDVGRVIVVKVIEKSWGPNYLEFGLGWEDDFTLDSVINLDFAFTLGNITDNNGEWRNELGIGTNKSWRSDLHLPLNDIQTYYYSTIFDFQREDFNLFVNNRRALVIESTTNRLDLALGYKPDYLSAFESGLTFGQGEFSIDAVLDDNSSYRSQGVFVRLGYDSLDRLNFPSHGARFTVSVTQREEDLSGDPIIGGISDPDTYSTTEYLADWKAATTLGHHGFIAEAQFAYVDSEIDQSVHLARLGGFLNLSGYHRDSLIGNQKVFAALLYQYNLGRSLFGFNNVPIYIGTSIEMGNVWSADESINYDELITAGSVYISTDSKLGPVAIAVGYTEDGNSAIYFYLGKNI